MKKINALLLVLQITIWAKAQDPIVAQLSNEPAFFTSSVSTTFIRESDQLFSDATAMMFGGQNEEALSLFEKAAESFKSEKRFHEWTGCFAGMAIVLSAEGRYRKFLHISKRALRIHYKFNALDLDAEETLKSNVGMGYRLIGNSKKADKYWPLQKN
jgi:tetratricopeptide (TPR) repeat protein